MLPSCFWKHYVNFICVYWHGKFNSRDIAHLYVETSYSIKVSIFMMGSHVSMSCYTAQIVVFLPNQTLLSNALLVNLQYMITQTISVTSDLTVWKLG